jgi:signal transduction histidine kinase
LRQAHVGLRETYTRAATARMMRPVRELRCLRRDGSEFIAEIGLVPLHFKNQNCTVANVHDITERRQLETERAEHEKRFRSLSRRLVEVQEAERRKLSTELHDRTSPGLGAIQINLNMLVNLLDTRATEDVTALLDDTAGLIADTTLSIREISSNLRPTVLDDGGLLPALSGYAQQFMQRTGVAVHLQTQDATRALTPAVQSSLFRIVQEALTNCAKHAQAGNVTIRLCNDGNRVSLTIADDGVGFDIETLGAPGLGLLTMRERAEFAGGSFSLETKPGLGTRIKVIV